ncbi:partial Potassium-transporting ATPase KdpC subunit [Anaerolineae bacterium]|nr:potassium-transporting ATPase subunit KdpC [Sandaracinaceae bacterium]CAG0991056.1 partial Potassium-transporting ATPase KdpC subunit [Anaerolineae bacterium]
MTNQLRPAIVLLAAFTLITGVLYPTVVSIVSNVFMASHATGTLIRDSEGRVIASHFIGQPFDEPRYFWSRPSATGPSAYNAAASSGSNLGPTNPALAEAVAARITALREADPRNRAPVPVDLVTASGSGLDPHISPAAAYYQAPRVARARELTEDRVRALVAEHTEDRFLGILGEPVVNVLQLNLALDRLAPER